MGKRTKKVTEAQREASKAKVDEAIKRLDQGVANILDADEFKSYLRFVSSFYNYSWGNVMLISIQRPDATLVAGYRDWQAKGRQVRKGERGIAILAPVVKKVEDDETGEKTRKVVGFRATSVFDVSQTDGNDLPTPPTVTELTGESTIGASVVKLAETYAIGQGVKIKTVGRDVLGEAKGAYTPKLKEIMVRDDLATDHRAKTLIHEIVHHALHAKGAASRSTAEVEAEGTAYVVLDHFGIDTSDYSFGYVAGWSAKPEVVRAALATIQKTARDIIVGLTDVETDVEEEVA